MIIKYDGISIEANTNDNLLLLRVLEQSPEFTSKLKSVDSVTDESTGISIKSNNRPAWKKSTKTIYLRGADASRNDDVITIEFQNPNDCRNAILSVDSLIKAAAEIKSEYEVEANGGTADCRRAIITESQAKVLTLTDHDKWSSKRRWAFTNPVHTINKHYNEHIGQLVDVLNKAFGFVEDNDSVVNHHKVTQEEAKWAYDYACKFFDEAEAAGPGFLVATWRLISGMRGPDFQDQKLISMVLKEVEDNPNKDKSAIEASIIKKLSKNPM